MWTLIVTFLKIHNKQPDKSRNVEAALTEAALEGNIVSQEHSLQAFKGPTGRVAMQLHLGKCPGG